MLYASKDYELFLSFRITSVKCIFSEFIFEFWHHLLLSDILYSTWVKFQA